MVEIASETPPAANPGLQGFVADPPAKLGDPFTVLVPGFSSDHAFEIRKWSARGLTIPAAGDEVLVVFDDDQEPWAAAWWPTAGDVAISKAEPTEWKASCRAATTANITIATALNNGDSLDGLTLATGDRVLVKDQTTTKENGIWVVGATPVRATDADEAGDLSGGTTVYVEAGTVNAQHKFYISTIGLITPGTTSHVWSPVPPMGGLVESNGTKAGGIGFTSEKTGTGVYKIVLSTELATLASFVATPVATRLIPEAGLASKKTFTVAFYTTAAVLTDSPFSFVITPV